MGSHGGATPEEQLGVLAHYGVTEATMGCPLLATMEVVQVGEALGLPVWLDALADEADWTAIVNRIKPHTDFKGSIRVRPLQDADDRPRGLSEKGILLKLTLHSQVI